MGNDGGSIPKRSDLVKSSAKAPTTSDLFEYNSLHASFIWTTCILSKKPLEFPIVSDYKGHLFNKESILEWLISPEKFGDGESTVPHIKSMKDVVELKISKDSAGRWICPITRKELKANGGKFVYLSECGHVFTENALREIDSSACLECGAEFDQANLVIINPTIPEDIEQMRQRIERLRALGLTHSLKPAVSKKKRKDTSQDSKKKKKVKESDSSGRIRNESTLSMTKSVMEDLHRNEIKRTAVIKDLYLNT
ncbi:Rtf2 RING-finger-domain-containing protein [Dipodascopsis uninucleata]